MGRFTYSGRNCPLGARLMKHTLIGSFNDSVTWNGEEKTAVSVRDGVLEYLGAELGLEPVEKTFTVYRSPATIARANAAMNGVPLTDEHVTVGHDVKSPVGSVLDSEIIDFIDESTSSHLALRNRVRITDAISGALKTGKQQLSLGYNANLVPHERFDFEQVNIQPHHLAVVPAGRCGSACSFIDRQPTEVEPMKTKQKTEGQPELHTAFVDAEGQPNLQQIVEIAQQLPEALKSVPMDKLQEIMPTLQEIVSMGGAPAPAAEEPALEDEEPMEDEEPSVPVTDTAEFRDAVNSAIRRHTEVIEKAKTFVDESYQFAGKATDQIMRDALAVEHGKQEFSDAELSVAFKLLKKTGTDLRTFGDASLSAGKFSSIADKEL